MKVVKISEAFEKLAKEKIYNLFNDLPFVNEVSFKKICDKLDDMSKIRVLQVLCSLEKEKMVIRVCNYHEISYFVVGGN